RRLSYSGPGILLILGLQQVRRRPARRSAPLNCRQISKRLVSCFLWSRLMRIISVVTYLFVIFARFCFRYSSNLCVCDIHRLPSSSRTRPCAVSQSPLLIWEGGRRGFVYQRGRAGTMKAAGRKNIRRASKEDGLSLREGQGIMRVVSLRGSNVIEVGSWMPKVLNLSLYFQPNFRRAFGLKQV
ncbi:hypothetical protein BHE74_00029541, partial [Ensete ventricosum]